MRTPFPESPEFRRLLRGDPGADLTRIALEIARDAYPGLDLDAYLGKIEVLAARVRDRSAAAAGTRQVLGQINWVLFVEEGYRGNVDAYDDPRNSYLNEVIDRKTGIPISLSVLYLALADRLRLPMAGVNLPGHFMLRTVEGGTPVFVDPFHGGVLLDRRGCERRISDLAGRAVALAEDQFAPCPSPLVVARMLRNLKLIYVRENDFPAALPVLRRLVALAGDDPQERRDLGMVCMHAALPGEAIDHLQAYLDARPQDDDAETVRSLLGAAWRHISLRN